MLKPFRINGEFLSQKLIDTANRLGLSESCIRHRIANKHWSREKACSTAKQKGNWRDPYHYAMEIKPDPNGPMSRPVNTYFLSPDEIRERYGEPGQLMHHEEKPKSKKAYHW